MGGDGALMSYLGQALTGSHPIVGTPPRFGVTTEHVFMPPSISSIPLPSLGGIATPSGFSGLNVVQPLQGAQLSQMIGRGTR